MVTTDLAEELREAQDEVRNLEARLAKEEAALAEAEAAIAAATREFALGKARTDETAKLRERAQPVRTRTEGLRQVLAEKRATVSRLDVDLARARADDRERERQRQVAEQRQKVDALHDELERVVALLKALPDREAAARARYFRELAVLQELTKEAV